MENNEVKWNLIEKMLTQTQKVNKSTTPNFTDKVMLKIEREIKTSRRPVYYPFSPIEGWRDLVYRLIPVPALVVTTVLCTLFVQNIFHRQPTEIWLKFELNPGQANTVSLVGDFNQWDTQAGQMVRSNGSWKIILPFKSGKQYKYVYVVDGTNWVPDPTAEYLVDVSPGKKAAVLDLSSPKVHQIIQQKKTYQRKEVI